MSDFVGHEAIQFEQPAMIRRSDSIANLATDLAKAQAEIEGASKDKTNPHFKSSYADLASVRDACMPALSKFGLSVVQMPTAAAQRVTVTTLLAHKSGEWIESALEMTAGQNTPQAIGSCITYARRYALAAMVGVAPEDDDGNAASNGASNGAQQANGRTQQAPPKPAGFDRWLTDMEATADEGWGALEAAWKASPADRRAYLQTTNAAKWDAIKKRAKDATAKATEHAHA